MNNCKTTEILSIERINEEETYDLEVDHPDHTFFANGISVSNSHSLCYSIVSYICAHLLYYYPDEWLASYLNTQTEPEEKEPAISAIKSFGFIIKETDINLSENTWVPTYDNSLVQPISSVKGIGEKALEELFMYRPYNSIEELIFHPKISKRKVSKKILDALVKSGSLNDLMRKDGYTSAKHLWLTIVEDRPKTLKQYKEKFEKNKDCQDFTDDEKISFQIDLCGRYPVEKVVDQEMLERLERIGCVPISEFKGQTKVAWGIVKDIQFKKTGTGKDYAVISMIDSSFNETTVKCWSWNFKRDEVHKHNLYFIKLKYEQKWGLSCPSLSAGFKHIPKKSSEGKVQND